MPGPPFLGILSPPYIYADIHTKSIHMTNETTDRNVNNIDNIIGQLPRIVRGEVVSATLHEKYLTVVLGLQCFQSSHVGTDVLANGCVGAAACFDGKNALGRERFVFDEELLVLASEDVVRDRRWGTKYRQDKTGGGITYQYCTLS
jgi:hypothetical protein